MFEQDIAVFFIDDNAEKLSWLDAILDRANAIVAVEKLSYRFYRGFKGDPKLAAIRDASDANRILKALKTTNAILLLDVAFKDEERDTDGLRQAFTTLLAEEGRKKGGGWAKAALDEFAIIRSGHANVTSGHANAARTADKHAVGLLLALCATKLQRRCLLASTDAESAHATSVHLVTRIPMVADGFPTWPCPKTIRNDEVLEECTRLAEQLIKASGVRECHPVDELWANSLTWFSKNASDPGFSVETHGLPHKPDWSSVPLAIHEACVRKAMPWIPQVCDWWLNEENAAALHECLKGLVGCSAECSGGRYPLPLGGAYLIFLLSLSRGAPNEIPKFICPDWRAFLMPPRGSPEAPPIPFLPLQGASLAKRTIMMLFDFISAVLSYEDEGKNVTAKVGFLGIEYPAAGQSFFRLELAWTDRQVEKFGSSLISTINDWLNDTTDIKAAGKTGLSRIRGTTQSAYLRFLLSSQLRKSGAGPVGSLTISEDRWLKLGR